MKKKEATLTNCMVGFQKEEVHFNDYEVSLWRWLVSQVDYGNLLVTGRERPHTTICR